MRADKQPSSTKGSLEVAVEDIPGLDTESSATLRGLFRNLGIREVRLYGSRAKGTHRHGSDIDLCIMGGRLSLERMAQLEEAIDELLLPYEIDICNYCDIENPELLAHIDRCGLPIFREE
ncbi:MAG: nucleotidyltransferase domain-containing protein [Spirochaetaceae bacterium]|nr:MAG: nucleotidyltransferase domain-containing protein [Spirochaetaceae bacterium]